MFKIKNSEDLFILHLLYARRPISSGVVIAPIAKLNFLVYGLFDFGPICVIVNLNNFFVKFCFID